MFQLTNCIENEIDVLTFVLPICKPINLLTCDLVVGHRCPAGTHQCDASGQCIEDDRWCDFFRDCLDGSDEESCRKLLTYLSIFLLTDTLTHATHLNPHQHTYALIHPSTRPPAHSPTTHPPRNQARPTHSFTHPLTYYNPFTYSLTFSLIHSILPDPKTHSLTHLLT